MAHVEESEQASSFEAFDDGIAEAKRRDSGNFDGLFGQLPHNASRLLRDIVSDLRDCVLQDHKPDEARCLLLERVPRNGYRNVTPIADDVALALSLLTSIHSATLCEGDRFANLIFGPAGARDEKRQAGTRKERRPEITEWIDRQLSLNPSAKSPELWGIAPEWLTDQISLRRFATRVTGRRKARASK
jgi:hypothetical protein